MIHHPDDVPRDCYRYFPGVYPHSGGPPSTRESLRCVFRRCILPSCWSIPRGAVRRDRLSRLPAPGRRPVRRNLVPGALFALEGFAAVTEPIATMPFLAAMLAWGGRRLAGGRGYLLGTRRRGRNRRGGMRQTAGRPAFPGSRFLADESRHGSPREAARLRALCSPCPSARAVVFLAGIACEAKAGRPWWTGYGKLPRTRCRASSGTLYHLLNSQ